MAFVADSVVQAAVQDALKQYTGLGAWVSNIATRAHARAYNLIVRTMANKGFSLTQITTWDEGASFEVDLAVWYTLTNDNVLHTIGVDEKFAVSFDRSKELAAVTAFTAAGVPMVPTGPYGLPQSGAESTDSLFGEYPDDHTVERSERPLRF